MFQPIKPVYVAAEGGSFISLGSGVHVVAAVPPNRGDGDWGALTDSNRFARVRGERISGLGVETALSQIGYVKAEPSDKRAVKLLDELAARAGIKAVEEASKATAQRLTETLGGQKVTLVPFDATQAITEVEVAPPENFYSVVLGLGVGLSSGNVKAYAQINGDARMADFQVNSNWVVPAGQDPAAMPRVSDYGGPVEEAMFLLAATGLGTLIGEPHLRVLEDIPLDDQMPRGAMALQLEGGDVLAVGIDAGDELLVRLVRNGQVVRERSGLIELNGRIGLAAAVGSITAILALDAWANAPVKGAKSKAKLAKAA